MRLCTAPSCWLAGWLVGSYLTHRKQALWRASMKEVKRQSGGSGSSRAWESRRQQQGGEAEWQSSELGVKSWGPPT